MPVITLYADRFSSFVGRPLTAEEMVKWLPWLGVDIEETGPDYVKVEFNPNRIDLSSYAGVARAFCGLRGWETGLPRYEVREGDIVLRVDPRVSRVRPYVVAAVVCNLSLDDEAVKELMEMQEDIHWGVGRDRRKVSIGVHNLDAVQPPFTYTAAEPDAVRFVPLDKTEEMSLREVLERHEKGVAYRHLVEGFPEYPLITDRNGDVLSFPPIINGELTRVSRLTRNLFIDVTGLDFRAVNWGLNILVTALSDMGGALEAVRVEYPDRAVVCPDLSPRRMKLRVEYARRMLGLKLSEAKVADSLRRCRLGVVRAGEGVLGVSVPPYRIDVMHEIDLVEEVALGYGFFRLRPTRPRAATTGAEHRLSTVARHAREAMVGLGFVEVMNLILTNEADHYQRMRLRAGEAVKLANPVSADYSIVRGSLLPGLMRNLADNRHESYPQRLFEVSDVIRPNLGRETATERRVHAAAASCHPTANFTEIKSCVEALLNNLGATKYEIGEVRHPSFIPGRAAAIRYRRRSVGVLGEIHPEVLNNFQLENPTGAFEVDLEQILQATP